MKKLCKDCKYYKKYYGYGGSTGIYDECLCPLVIKEKDLVRGEVHINFVLMRDFLGMDVVLMQSILSSMNHQYLNPLGGLKI